MGRVHQLREDGLVRSFLIFWTFLVFLLNLVHVLKFFVERRIFLGPADDGSSVGDSSDVVLPLTRGRLGICEMHRDEPLMNRSSRFYSVSCGYQPGVYLTWRD